MSDILQDLPGPSLADAYPECRDAVEACESAYDEKRWESFRRNMTPEKVLTVTRISARLIADLREEDGLANTERLALLRRAIPQMETPAFLNYVKAKMGAL